MMICPRCGAQFEGNTCPGCSLPEESPSPTATAVESRRSNMVLFVILGLTGGILAILTLAFLMISLSFSKTPSPVDEKPVLEQSDERSIPQGADNLTADEDAQNNRQQEKGIYQSGDYAIGTDIPAGTYIILSDEMGYGDFYTSVYASESMSVQSEIYSGWTKNSRYVMLEDGQYLHFSHATMYDPELVEITLDPFSSSGMFLVGRDLEPGTYTVVPNHNQYSGSCCVYSSLTPSGLIKKDFYYVGLDGSEEITLLDGEYVQTDFCILRK